MPGATGSPSLDLGHPDVQALVGAGISADRLGALTKGKKIDHPATQEVVVNQPAPIALPSIDTTGASTIGAAPQAFAQQLAQSAPQPVPSAGSTEASLDAQTTTPPQPTNPAETADAVYQQFLAAMQ